MVQCPECRRPVQSLPQNCFFCGAKIDSTVLPTPALVNLDKMDGRLGASHRMTKTPGPGRGKKSFSRASEIASTTRPTDFGFEGPRRYHLKGIQR